MDFVLVSIISLIIGFMLSYFILRLNKDNNSNLSKDIQHLLELQKKDWEKGQLDFKGLVNCLSVHKGPICVLSSIGEPIIIFSALLEILSRNSL